MQAATPQVAPTTPVYLARDSSGVMSEMMICDICTIPPPPRPWMPRQTQSQIMFCAAPQSAEPCTNEARGM